MAEDGREACRTMKEIVSKSMDDGGVSVVSGATVTPPANEIIPEAVCGS